MRFETRCRALLKAIAPRTSNGNGSEYERARRIRAIHRSVVDFLSERDVCTRSYAREQERRDSHRSALTSASTSGFHLFPPFCPSSFKFVCSPRHLGRGGHLAGHQSSPLPGVGAATLIYEASSPDENEMGERERCMIIHTRR